MHLCVIKVFQAGNNSLTDTSRRKEKKGDVLKIVIDPAVSLCKECK